MDNPDFDRLRAMLDQLPKNDRETVRLCWDHLLIGPEKFFCMYGIKVAALGYMKMLERDSENMPDAKRKPKTPHQVEKELVALAASARDLVNKIQHISPEAMTMIENAAIRSERPSNPDLEWFSEENCTFNNAAVHSWFQIRRGHQCEDGSLEEDEPWWGQDGMRPFELEALAQSLEWMAKDAAARKEAPNGPREKVAGRLNTVEWFLFQVGMAVLLKRRPQSHILSIAKQIHEWATGEIPGADWGKRPFEKVKQRFKDSMSPDAKTTRMPWVPQVIYQQRVKAFEDAIANQEVGIFDGGTPIPF